MAWRLRPFDLLAGIVAADTAALGRLDALAVDHRRGRAGLAPDPLAIAHDQVVVDRLPRAVVAQPGEPAIHRAPRREAVRHEPPRDAAAQHVEDRVDDLAHRPRTLPAAGGLGGQEAAQGSPIPRRSGRFHSAAPRGYAAAGWSGSTSLSRQVVANLDESRFDPAAQPLTRSYRRRFETASQIADELAKLGHLGPSGKPYFPGSITNMLKA